MDFGEVLGRTWKIGWNHKMLWIFQMIPGALAVIYLPISFIFNPAFVQFLPPPLNRLLNESAMLIVFLLLTLLYIIVAIFAGVISQSATTLGALRVEKGTEELSFQGLLKDGLPYFWRILGIMVLFMLAWLLIMGGFMAFDMIVSLLTLGFGMLCLMPFFLLFIPLFLIGYSWIELSQVAVLSDQMGITDALTRGWQIIRGNILQIALLVIIIYFGLWIVSAVLIFPMMIPMWFLPLGINANGEFNRSFIVFFLVLFPVLMLVMTVVQGIAMAFAKSAWAVAYLRLTKPKTESQAPIVLPANA